MYGIPAPDKVTYYAEVATSDPGRAYKRRMLDALAPAPGHTVLDVGCGPGTDLAALADAVTPSGVVVGVDFAAPMVAQARQRMADTPWVRVLQGDAHALPVAEDSVNRARADRVLQHVADPAAVFTQFRRVLRPGGVVCVAEPDWAGLLIDPGDEAVLRTFTDFVCTTMVRNATIGRRLPRLAQQAGLEVLDVLAAPPVFRDFASADRIFGLSRNTERAIRAGVLARGAGQRWLAELAAGPFFATAPLFILVARTHPRG